LGQNRTWGRVGVGLLKSDENPTQPTQKRVTHGPTHI